MFHHLSHQSEVISKGTYVTFVDLPLSNLFNIDFDYDKQEVSTIIPINKETALSDFVIDKQLTKKH